jgi:hypothetical protein
MKEQAGYLSPAQALRTKEQTAGPSAPLRSGRDDTSFSGKYPKRPEEWISVVRQKCHPDRSVPGFPATQHWTKPRVRLSLKERRMSSANATKVHRKSGVAKWRDLLFLFLVLTRLWGYVSYLVSAACTAALLCMIDSPNLSTGSQWIPLLPEPETAF